MKAWIIEKTCDLSAVHQPLRIIELPVPETGEGKVLIKVSTCGVCHTEIDEIEGRTPPPRYPMVPGHQVVGIVQEHRGNRSDIHIGSRVGVAWIYSVCGKCEYCISGRENLCDKFIATGRDANGGYAEYMVVPEKFVYPIPGIFSDTEAAPLLCAGAIGYRSYSLCRLKAGQKLGLTGFGASAHLVVKLVKYISPETEIYVFARNPKERKFAMELGCAWSGDTFDKPPHPVDCIIDTTPAWQPVIKAMEVLKPGGRLVINAIRKERIDQDKLLSLNYHEHLWMEKEIKSVANVTRKDVEEFIRLAAEMPFKPKVQEYPFMKANEAIMDIKNRKIEGAKVLVMK